MKDRIQKLMDTLGITATRLADEIQVQRSGISHILSGRNQPSYDFITRLLERYPEIDARWLLTGKGDIYTRETDELPEQLPGNPLPVEQTDIVRSEDKPIYKVTNVNKIIKVILLHSDGTFEEYKPGGTR